MLAWNEMWNIMLSLFHSDNTAENSFFFYESHTLWGMCLFYEKTLLINLIKHNIIKYLENNTSYDTFSISDVRVYFGVMLIRWKYDYEFYLILQWTLKHPWSSFRPHNECCDKNDIQRIKRAQHQSAYINYVKEK